MLTHVEAIDMLIRCCQAGLTVPEAADVYALEWPDATRVDDRADRSSRDRRAGRSAGSSSHPTHKRKAT